MFQPDENGIYASVHASPARRLFAYAVLLLLGGVVLYTALAHPPTGGWLVFLLFFGIGALWLAERLRRATLLRIDLTATDIRDSAGTVLATMDEIKSVERGVFAFKPSNGFTLVVETRKPRGWAPGLWWGMGRRVGVGGVTSAGQAKFMAEQIAFRLNQRSN
ncbi:MAG: hypothetical protein AAFY31_10820 [Pseudomonadota bacterium]